MNLKQHFQRTWARLVTQRQTPANRALWAAALAEADTLVEAAAWTALRAQIRARPPVVARRAGAARAVQRARTGRKPVPVAAHLRGGVKVRATTRAKPGQGAGP